MPQTYANLSMSLDGYIAGPNVRVGNGMGDDGDRLHDWMFVGKSGEEIEAFFASQFTNVGAVIMGRTMFDVGVEPWGDEPVFHVPVFVVTHRPAASIEKAGGTTYHFVTDGLAAAFGRAREVAGDRDILLDGGADIVRQAFEAGVVDELRLHVVPIVFGAGTPLFLGGTRWPAFATSGEVDAAGITHLTLRPADAVG